MDMNEEKRKMSRADHSIKVQAKYMDNFFNGEIKDFSLTGFLFSSDEVMDIAEGEKLIILITWDDEAQDMMSQINCIVIRKVSNILGLKFDVIDNETLMLLKEKLIGIVGKDKINHEFIDFLLGN